jgi:hypothetical protein
MATRTSGARKDRTGSLYRREYNASPTDRHYGATSPLKPESCSCESPGFAPGDECWKCGRPRQPEQQEER